MCILLLLIYMYCMVTPAHTITRIYTRCSMHYRIGSWCDLMRHRTRSILSSKLTHVWFSSTDAIRKMREIFQLYTIQNWKTISMYNVWKYISSFQSLFWVFTNNSISSEWSHFVRIHAICSQSTWRCVLPSGLASQFRIKNGIKSKGKVVLCKQYVPS